MLKKFISVFLCLMLVSTVFVCAPASAETTKITLKNRASYDEGYTTIKWDVEGDEPDKVLVFIQLKDNGEDKQQLIRLGETSNHSIRTEEMLPGKTYEVTLTSSIYSILAQADVTVPEAEDFVNGKMTTKSVKITLDPMKLKSSGTRSKDTKKIKELVAADIKAGIDDGDYLYGLKYTMKMPQLAKGREFYTTVAFEAPTGFTLVVVADTLTFDRVNNGYQTVWFYMIGDYFFKSMYSTVGDIPSGTYKIHLYWDGMWVNTSTFKVK